jgi:membrane protein
MTTPSTSCRSTKRRIRTPIWAPVATVLLFAAGFRAQRSDDLPSSAHASATSLDPKRGRFAAKPSDIPPRGWKDILLRVRDEISEDRIVAIGAGIAFFGLLAIFPGIAALVALYGLFADPATIAKHLETVSGFVPAGGLEIINDQMNRVVAQGGGTLGLAFFIGLAVSLWSANSGTKAVFDALNIVYNEKERRSFLKLNAMSLLFTAGAIAFLLISIVVMIVLPIAFQYLGLADMLEAGVKIGRWPILLVALGLMLAVLYRYGPSRDKAQWRWVSWGSAFAALMWVAASILFSWYATNFGTYNETYGSLGAVVGFMTWIWLSAIVILVGAELDAEMEHQTIHDTTTGAPKPLGRRGAYMADTVGAAHR